MSTKTIPKESILMCLNHASTGEIRKLAKEVAEFSYLNINIGMVKEELINTMIAVYTKTPEMLPDDAILNPDLVHTFSFDAYCKSPYPETSIYHPMFMRLYDTYKGKSFTSGNVKDVVSVMYKEYKLKEHGTEFQIYKRFLKRIRYNEKVVVKTGDKFRFIEEIDA